MSSQLRRSRQNPLVRDFILRNVRTAPEGIGALAAKKFELSRTAIARYLGRLVEEGLLSAEGNTKARRYALKQSVDEAFSIKINAHVEEDVVWRHRILPFLDGVLRNVVDICQYGFTEMLNNAIDHSASATATIGIEVTYADVTMMVADKGVGIFNKIQRDFQLADPRSALLELSKGKLTSDRKRHAGEGIFFTSRMFDEYSILSGGLYYSRKRGDGAEWLIETEESKPDKKGTAIFMRISTAAEWTTRTVFESYQGGDIGFRKTHVPVALGRYPGEQLVSRSQAKRLLSRFDQFSEVMLDFQGVEEIGQPFADEIFRVFALSHPGTPIYAIGTSPEIDRMIAHVRGSGEVSQDH
ncbi:MAG: STAS-like domain-containing protein [Magnetospirillum sp.]|nr:STAS-like domain-containing protein [Magnetospirillum sp.]